MNLQDAFYQLVHSAPGGCEALAVRLDMSAAVLRNKANPNAAHNKPTMDDIERVTALTGDLRILHAWASSLDRVVVEVADGMAPNEAPVSGLVAAAWSTNGNVGKEIMAALADGRITQAEYECVAAAVKDAERALETVVARFRSMVEKSPRYGAQ